MFQCSNAYDGDGDGDCRGGGGGNDDANDMLYTAILHYMIIFFDTYKILVSLLVVLYCIVLSAGLILLICHTHTHTHTY